MRIASLGPTTEVFLNGKLAYTSNHKRVLGELKALVVKFDFMNGEIDYVRIGKTGQPPVFVDEMNSGR